MSDDPTPQVLAERIQNLRELGDLREKLNERALALAAAQTSNRVTTIIAILAVIVAAWALRK
jgi:hypothetical protein